MRRTYFISMAEGIGETVWEPRADVCRVRGGWVIKFDLAGISPKDIALESRGNQLVLSGVRRDMLVAEDPVHYSLEISYSQFRRTIPFDFDLTTAQISSDYSDGMLVVRIQLEDR